EAPSPAVDGALRERMGAAAVNAAAAIGYRGAGTVEFLYEPASGEFYFMEMNTRLQVEHPVTEMSTGLDLVEWQLRVAAGEVLPLTQEEITFSGHAMEVRLCAEDPAAGFMPQTGTIRAWRAPSGPGIRADHGVATGSAISPHYDSMLGKTIARGADRGTARTRLLAALDRTLLLGVTHNKHFLGRILRHDVFAGGDFDIHFIDRHMPQSAVAAHAPQPWQTALAGALFHAHDAVQLARMQQFDTNLTNWRSSHAVTMPGCVAHDDTVYDLQLDVAPGGRYAVTLADAEPVEIEFEQIEEGRCRFMRNGVRSSVDYVIEGNRLWLAVDGASLLFEDRLLQAPETDAEGGDGRIKARMDGRIIDIAVTEGERVQAGQKLLVLEAMKMEFSMDA